MAGLVRVVLAVADVDAHDEDDDVAVVGVVVADDCDWDDDDVANAWV